MQIGTDGGFLPAPVRLTELTIGIAERFDVVIDFSGTAGPNVRVSPTTRRRRSPTATTSPDQRHDVQGRQAASAVATTARFRDPLGAGAAARSAGRRSTPAISSSASSTRPTPFENPIIGLINAPWSDPVTETPQAGSVEIWRIINTTGDAHPIHIHLVQFQILDRQPFDLTRRPSLAAGWLASVFTGPAGAADAARRNERPPPSRTPSSRCRARSRASSRGSTCPAGPRVQPGPEVPLRVPLPHPGARRQRHDEALRCRRLDRAHGLRRFRTAPAL